MLVALVAAPGAGAATFADGPISLDFKSLKVKVAVNPSSAGTKTGAKLEFTEGEAGSVSMTAQASGSLNIGTSATSITLTHANKKKIVLKSLVQKLTAGKGQLTAKVNGSGKAIAFFDQATTNNVKPAGDFSTLDLLSSKMTLSKAGAAALNKAFGLKAPAKGKKDLRLKAKAAVGTVSFTAERVLSIAGGATRLVYNPAFVQGLRDCGISLGAVAPGTAIEKSQGAPEGGVELPITGGSLNAKRFLGTIQHSGGTVLDRPEPGQPGNPTQKPKYNSPLTNLIYNFGETENVLTAFVVNLTNTAPIGNVSGTFGTQLNDTGGPVNLTGGSLNLSSSAATLLSSQAAPLGADCPIAAGTQIGSFEMTTTGS